MEDIPSFIDAIKGLGVASGPVFAVFWWLERTERRECQARSLMTASEAATGLAANTSANAELRNTVEDGFNRIMQALRSIKKDR